MEVPPSTWTLSQTYDFNLPFTANHSTTCMSCRSFNENNLRWEHNILLHL